MWRLFFIVLAPLVLAVRDGHQNKEAGQLTHGGWKIVGVVESSRLETPLASKNVMRAAASVFFLRTCTCLRIQSMKMRMMII